MLNTVYNLDKGSFKILYKFLEEKDLWANNFVWT